VLLGLNLAGCDFSVGPGQTVRLGNGVQLSGAPGDAQRGGGVGVDVQATGTLVVEDADVFGGDDAVLKPADTAMGAGVVRGGAAISATGAQVIVLAGTVEGGDANAGRGFGFAGNGINLLTSTLFVEGGVIRAGRTTRGAAGRAVSALGSSVQMTGGSIDDLELRASTAVVKGGSLGSVVMGSIAFDVLAFQPFTRNCLEIAGGDIRGPLMIERSTDLFVVGTVFNLPFGEVTAPDPIALVGRLVDGRLLSTFVFRGNAGGDAASRVFLVDAREGLISGSNCLAGRL
jgi:hypothetical protein